MKKKYNNLLTYIYEYSDRTQRKETVNGLFRAILEPLWQNQKIEAVVLLRTFDTKDKASYIKRLAISGIQIFNYSDTDIDSKYKNLEKNKIWNNTEFIVVLGGRYSAALIWDYSDSEIKDCSKVCLLYNSRIILDIAKIIADNSTEDISSLLKKYVPDRRENMAMNKSVQSIASMLNDKNEEYIFNQNEKNSLVNDENTIQTAEIITNKAKFISHEIKNHLSIINLYSTIANRRFEKIKGEEEILQSIKNAIKNISNASENISYLINDLRCMSKPVKTEIKMNLLIEEALELCKLRMESFGVKLFFNKTEDNTVTTDKVKVQCAVTNIIFNAVDAHAKNIFVSIKDNIIFIKNDGDIIPENIQSRIFEENFTTKEHGNGLGLAFCKKQLQSVDGDIILIASTEKETVFEIKI